MRTAILAVLATLAVGPALCRAQSPANGPAPAAPRPGSWEAIVTSAAAASPGAPPQAGAATPPQAAAPRPGSWEALMWSTVPSSENSTPPPEPDDSPDRFWFRLDYLLWWTRSGPMPPLLTTGPDTATIIGGLTQPGTQVVFGGSQNYDTRSGLRLDLGWWFDKDQHCGLEFDYFRIGRSSTGVNGAADASGNPVLAQPLVNPTTGQEFTEVIALPGLLTGGAMITTHSRLQGWEINALLRTGREEPLSFGLLAGFRTASLDESLQMGTTFASLTGGFLTFEGQPVGASSSLATFDSFQAQTHFYGPQVGGRVEWSYGRLAVAGLAKVAFGDSQELVRIVGASSLITPGAATVTVPGGVLAQTTNIGDHFRHDFAVMPEAGLQIGCQVARNIEVHLGYTFLYWSSVVRPGDQVNRIVNPTLIPTDPAFARTTATQPAFLFQGSGYWAQGLNFGLELRF
jgi:hypothetical protein